MCLENDGVSTSQPEMHLENDGVYTSQPKITSKKKHSIETMLKTEQRNVQATDAPLQKAARAVRRPRLEPKWLEPKLLEKMA